MDWNILLESGRLELSTTTFNPAEVFEEGVDLFRGLARAKQLRLVARIAPNIPTLVNGDKKRVQQVFCNLLSNAIKFTSSGRIETSLTAMVDGLTQRLTITVVDTGIGIPAEKMEQVFLPFSQIDNSLTRSNEGTGLGLSISMVLSKLMGGDLVATSGPGQGSTFKFEFPVDIVPSTNEDDETGDDNEAVAVLLIEPDAGSRAMLVEMLNAIGVEDIEVHAGVYSDLQTGLAKDTWLIVAAELLDNLGNATTSQIAAFLDRLIVTTSTHLPLSQGVAAPQGATIVDLPCSRDRLREVLSPNSQLTSNNIAASKPSPNRVLHILVVEDNAANQRLAVAMLEQLGHCTDTAGNGEEGVAAVQQPNQKYDLILMDCRMPVMDGLSATKLIRAEEKRHGTTPVHIIAVTGDALDANRESCLAVGMDAVIKKPYTLEELAAAVAAIK